MPPDCTRGSGRPTTGSRIQRHIIAGGFRRRFSPCLRKLTLFGMKPWSSDWPWLIVASPPCASRSLPYPSKARVPELALVHRWLDNLGLRGIAGGPPARTGFDLDWRQYGDCHWRATFYVTEVAHSMLGGLGAYGAAGRAARGPWRPARSPTAR